MKKILVIVGPTASGKSDLAVRLARKFNGEVISADSRQVYIGLNIGTGKITKAEMKGVPHHLLDIANSKKRFSASEFVSYANKAIELIKGRRALPIVVGGTGFYIDVLTGAVSLPDVPPNKLLRKKLEKISKEKLFEMLKKKDPRRAKTIDKHNKVRLVRALEIAKALGRIPSLPASSKLKAKSFIFIGLKPDDLDKRIYKRLLKRITGILRETRKLSFKRAYELGLEYRYAALYLKGKLDKSEMVEQLYAAIRQYARRQMTWFKRNRKIKWFKADEYKKIEKHVKVSLEKEDKGG